MARQDSHDEIKRGWQPDESVNRRAVAAAIAAVEDARASLWLREYYTTDSDYAGATFLQLGQNDPGVVGPDDLFATTMLNVKIGAPAARRFQDSELAVSTLLGKIEATARIEDDEASGLAEHMADLHDAFKRILGGKPDSNPWVTASKLCARKRPNLFPVRDKVVIGYLGLGDGYGQQWPAFAAIMREPQVTSVLKRLVSAADAQQGVDVGDANHLLRHLDVVLWQAGLAGSRGS